MDRDIRQETWAITGSSGRIGTTLRAGLRDRVARVVLIDSVPTLDIAASESALSLDIADVAGLTSALAGPDGRGVDGVIHLAAIADEADLRDLVTANFLGTANVLEAARRAGVTRIVYASTGRTLGMAEVGELVDAWTAVRPDSFYAVTKIAGEALCRLYVDKFGFTATALRIGAFKPAPEEQRDLSVWLSPGDAVRAVAAAMQRPAGSFDVLIAVSANRDSWFDLEPGRAIGYFPIDDASELLAGEPLASGRFAGRMATPEFTLDRQRVA
jgi:uronate dehydrogenase